MTLAALIMGYVAIGWGLCVLVSRRGSGWYDDPDWKRSDRVIGYTFLIVLWPICVIGATVMAFVKKRS